MSSKTITYTVVLLPLAMLLPGIYTLVAGRTNPVVAIVCLVVGFVITGTGITVGYHRLATHKAFETFPIVKAMLLIAGSMAWPGPVLPWVEDHLKHHANSDIPGQDPHTPRDGLFWSHVGWLRNANQGEISLAKPLLRDPVVIWVSKWFPLWAVLSLAIPVIIGIFTVGWIDTLIWGGLIRIALVHHAMWAVNSASHRFGYQSFATHDDSTNCWPVALFALGEGWHNNHHAFPQSAFHGLCWWEIDFSGVVIGALEAVGLAWNVQRPTREMIARKLKP